MKILFVCSGNRNNGPSEVVLNQYQSLVKLGLIMDIYTIKGKGILGYLKNIRPLKQKIIKNNYDVIHAHYSLTGIVASLAHAKPLVVSLMGSDAHLKGLLKKLTLFYHGKSWDTTILKAIEMNEHLNLDSFIVMPNGVDTDRFKPMEKNEARKILNFSFTKKLLVFVANPERPEKNYKLAQDAMSLFKTKDVELITVYNVPNAKVPVYLNAADALILTSTYEGSVNVIKEAMACNTPIISTDVGDVRVNISGLENCYLSNEDPKDFALKVDLVLNSNQRSNGRVQLIKHQLDSVSVANKLKEEYKKHI